MMIARNRRRWRAVAAVGLATTLGVWATGNSNSSPAKATGGKAGTTSPPIEFGRPSGLPMPSRISVAQFEEKLFQFLNSRQYVELGWLRDKGVRDTGPYLAGQYFGTHPAVRVFYSPGVMRWLTNGRSGPIPDGEMIVKEQFAPPAERHRGKTEAELWNSLESWTVMIKDSSGSHDGWFWSNPVKNQCAVEHHKYPYDHPVSGFGLYCVRCHAVTETPGVEPASAANEFTFASLRNIAGFPGEPIRFRVDDSWRQGAKRSDPSAGDEHHDSHPKCAQPKPPPLPTRQRNNAFASFYKSIPALVVNEVAHLPPVTHDWVSFKRGGGGEYATSNQCMSCHAGLLAPFGPSMFIPAGATREYGAAGWDVSPYGEWRWSPMGLAGRDPVFSAQVESELAMIDREFASDADYAAELRATLVDTCLRCHGVTGKAQHDLDHPNAKFRMEQVHSIAGANEHIGHGAAKFGALARDGVSCVICHRMQPRPQPANDERPYLQFFLETSITGNYFLGNKNEIYGPFKDDEIASYTMEHATGFKPKYSEYLRSSQLCGTCHTISLPNIDRPLTERDPVTEYSRTLIKTQRVPIYRKYHQHIEQATYLEWLNSEYENEINRQNPKAKSCQDCHMSSTVKDPSQGIDVPQIRTRMAAIQDTTYPETENLAGPEKLHVRVREEGYRRHHFAGLNAFLIEMFNQFDDVLGVPKTDFMTGSNQGITNAVTEMVRTAREDVATVRVGADWLGAGNLNARVLVTNKVGHRFPSGVGFRRAFIELVVVEKTPAGSERVLWSSGRTNELGILIDGAGRPLDSEFFARDAKSGRQRYQKHYEVIDSPEQVQVYESLLLNAKGEFTTSFVRGCETIKDNRLLPRGWKREGPGPALTGRYLSATYPDSEVQKDPQYVDGSGTDEVLYKIRLPETIEPSRLLVRAALYYQSIPPYYLRNLFETAPTGPATRRLHYIASHLKLDGTPMENWKLRITGAECGVR